MESNATFMNENQLQIIVLNQSHIVRIGMASLIQKKFKEAEIFLVESYFSLVRALHKKKIDVLICEAFESFEKTSNFATRIKSINPNIKLLVLSNRKDVTEFSHTSYKNIEGFLNYNSNENDFYKALSFIMNDKNFVKTSSLQGSSNTAFIEQFSYRVNDLSNRELEVAQLYINGDGNLEISQRLNLSPSTVSTYKKRIFDKLGVNNVMSLAQIFETKVY